MKAGKGEIERLIYATRTTNAHRRPIQALEGQQFGLLSEQSCESLIWRSEDERMMKDGERRGLRMEKRSQRRENENDFYVFYFCTSDNLLLINALYNFLKLNLLHNT